MLIKPGELAGHRSLVEDCHSVAELRQFLVTGRAEDDHRSPAGDGPDQPVLSRQP